MITVPAAFAVDVVRGRGTAGQRWLESIPRLWADACARWDLSVDGAARHGAQGLVWPVRQGDQRAALKITWPDDMTRLEAAALAAWEGRGAVRLLRHDADHGLLLMERLDPDRTLGQVRLADAVVAAASVVRRLAVPAPPGIPTLARRAEDLVDELPRAWVALGEPFDRRTLDAAVHAARTHGPTAASLLVHRDLHYGNVLAGRREPWLAIDPMPLAGDPELGVARLLWRRFEEGGGVAGLAHRFATVVDVAGLDIGLARAWTLVHCVEYWLWALGIGLTEDPARMALITEWLLRD